MIITVGGIKGGSGKTTVSTTLAVLRAVEGRDVLLVDADDQETASDFTMLRTEQQTDGAGYTSIKLSGAAVSTDLQLQAPNNDDEVIATGGRATTSQRAALTVSDVLLVPFVPRSFDVWTLEKVSQLVGEMRAANPNLQAYAFINRADPRGQDNAEAEEVITETDELSLIQTPLGARKAFGNAAAHGLAVTELKPQDAKATHEMLTLYRHLFDVTTTSKKAVGA